MWIWTHSLTVSTYWDSSHVAATLLTEMQIGAKEND